MNQPGSRFRKQRGGYELSLNRARLHPEITRCNLSGGPAKEFPLSSIGRYWLLGKAVDNAYIHSKLRQPGIGTRRAMSLYTCPGPRDGNGKVRHMQESSTKKIYDIHSVFYDATFGRLVKRRIERAINHMNIQSTDRVLDLGIGTGVSLNYYPNRGRIIGVDLSGGMLREARKKIRERNLDNAIVFQADAMRLPFGDDTFDHVFISHVISVVSDPYRLVREAQRVAKPDARIVIVNHFQSTNRFIAMVEKFLCPLCTKLGWRSDLALQDLIRRTGAKSTTAISWKASILGDGRDDEQQVVGFQDRRHLRQPWRPEHFCRPHFKIGRRRRHFSIVGLCRRSCGGRGDGQRSLHGGSRVRRPGRAGPGSLARLKVLPAGLSLA